MSVCGLCAGRGTIECGSIVDGARWEVCSGCEGSGEVRSRGEQSLDPEDPENVFIVRVGRLVPDGWNEGVEFIATCEKCGAELREHGWWGQGHGSSTFDMVHSELPAGMGKHVCGKPDRRRDVRQDWPMR